eukprot:Colp12_sorted_trinity150504_noHs@29463
MLSEVGAHGGEQESLHLNEADDDVDVHVTQSQLTVSITGSLEIVETILKTVTVAHLFEGGVSLDNSVVDSVKEGAVGKGGGRARAHLLLVREHLLSPLQLSVQLQDCVVRRVLSKVGILHSITRVREREPRSIRTKLLNGLRQGQKVAGAFAHLLAIDQEMAVGTNRARPEFFLPNRAVCVEGEGEVVRNEILAGHTQIHRVPEPELIPETIQSLDRNLRVLGGCGTQEDVVPNFSGQLISTDVGGARARAIQNTPLQQMCDCVVRHIDGRIRQGLDQVLLIPRETGTQTKGTGASPLAEPPDCVVEQLLGRAVVGLKLREALDHLGLPLLLAIVQEPLVHEGHDTLVVRAGDHLTLRLKVHNSLVGSKHVRSDEGLGIGDL